MADKTNYFSLFLPPGCNNAGDPGKPLGDNFVILDESLWKIRTNYANSPPSEILETPLGAFAYDKINDKLYVMASDGIKLLFDIKNNTVLGTATGGGGEIDELAEAAINRIADELIPDKVSEELLTQLAAPIEQIDLKVQEVSDAKALAVQAAYDADQAKAAAISAANEAMGYKDDAYEWSDTAKTQAEMACGYAGTADTHRREAESSAGAAGLSAQVAEATLIQAKIASGNAATSAEATLQSRNEAWGFRNDAEEAAGASLQYSLDSKIGSNNASGYAQSSYNSWQSATSSSNQASGYALSASIASGKAENAAGKAEQYMMSVASVSGAIQSASQTAILAAQNASGYAENSRMYSVSASGYAQQAKVTSELVAAYLGAAEVSGYIGMEAEARADADSALAEQIETLSTTVDDHTTSLQIQKQTTDGIGGLYTVKIDNNGNVAGFGLASELVSGGAYSSFSVVANRFYVAKPNPEIGDIPKPIFVIDTDTGAVGIDGSLVAGSVYSKNWNATSGSYIDLNNGEIILGGYGTVPDEDGNTQGCNFYVDGNGILHARGAVIAGEVHIVDGSTGFGNLIDRPIFKGEWLSNISYREGDEVTYQGSTWGCLLTHISTEGTPPPTLPITSNLIWNIKSSKGDIGPQGENWRVEIESTNGNVFKPGQGTTTTLIAHIFVNDEEVTDQIDASRFRWRRVSFYQQAFPYDDDTWNEMFKFGPKMISITINSVNERATFHCDILREDL